MKRKIEFNKDPNQFQGPILDWYHTLQSTKIHNLELHQAAGPPNSSPPAVILLLVDGSMYRLYRTTSILRPNILPEFVDSIEHISLSDIGTQPVLRIHFNKDQGPDLLEVLSVCYGARTHGTIFTASQIVMDSDFFALALTLNIAQKCSLARVVAQASTESPLGLLWKDVFTLVQSQGYAFWADTTADRTKHLTRELICKEARSALIRSISDTDSDEIISRAAAAVARVEAIADRAKMGGPAVWDRAWHNQWKLVWRDFRPATRHRRINMAAKILGGLPTETPGLAIDGQIPGRAAGRSPMKFQLSSSCIDELRAISSRSQLFPQDLDPEVSERAAGQDLSAERRSQRTSHDQGQITTDHVPLPVESGSVDASILWLGHGHLNCSEGDNELWAVPSEVAVEMAWAEAWPRATDQGRIAARAVQEQEGRSIFAQESQSFRETTDIRTRRTTIHPGLEGSVSARRTAGRSVSWALGGSSIPVPKAETTTLTPETPPRASPKPRLAEIVSRIIRMNRLSRVSFPEGGGTMRSRTRAVGANALRKRVVSRHSDMRRSSRTETFDAFIDAVRERRYREKREEAQETAKRAMDAMAGEAILPDAQLEEMAEEALRHAKGPSSNLERSVKQLAKKEREKLLRGRGVVTSPFQSANPAGWEQGFVGHWERAWKESWIAAWREVWAQAWDAAVFRAVEFGVDEVLDTDPNARRTNHRVLHSRESFRRIQITIEDRNLDQLGTLKLVHSMMKELYSLHDLLRHTISNTRDGSMEICRQVKNTKARGSNGVDSEGWEKLTHSQLHQWAEHFINEKFKADPQLKESLKKLFLRGISEVWESASRVYREESISLGENEE